MVAWLRRRSEPNVMFTRSALLGLWHLESHWSSLASGEQDFGPVSDTAFTGQEFHRYRIRMWGSGGTTQPPPESAHLSDLKDALSVNVPT